MKKILLLLCVLSTFALSEATAQAAGWCGTTFEDQLILRDRLAANRAAAANTVQVRTGIRWVPIKFHLLQDNDGGNRVDVMKVFELLCSLNEFYLEQEIQFFIKDEFNFINSTSVNNNPQTSSNVFAANILTGAKVLGAVNVFIAKDIPNGNPLDVIGGYYTPTYDWLVMRRSYVSAAASSTFVHEMGHFLSLQHPFYGWPQGGGAYDVTVYGNPAPVTSPEGIPTELMSGANCMTAGDMICDTRPNYLFGFGFSGCNYNGGVMDPQGVLVDPQENNVMAYFDDCDPEFTPGQKTAMSQDLDSRTSLHNTLDPDVTPFATSPTQNYPIDGEQTPLFNVVGFDWEPVAGATSYIVEVDRQPTFSFDPSVKFVSGGTYVEFEDVFDADKKYYWRVKAFKDGYVCGEVVSTSFETGTVTGTREITEVLNYTISPNPISAGEVLNINIESQEAFDAVINVYNLSGQKVKEVNTTFDFGTTNRQLSVSDLNQGMYIISIESENGVLTEKVVVTR